MSGQRSGVRRQKSEGGLLEACKMALEYFDDIQFCQCKGDCTCIEGMFRKAIAKAESDFGFAVVCELHRARSLHGKIVNAHDGYGRLLEEVDDFWDEVKQKDAWRSKKRMFSELVQVAAMAQRTAEDLGLIAETQEAPNA